MKARALAAAAAAMLVAPIAIDLVTHDRRRVFSYLASDAYYYLNVAWNFAHTGKLSYDQIHASNGYHPLWQILEALLFTVGRPLPDLWLLWAMVLGSAFLLAGAIWLCARLYDELSPLYALLPLGFYGAIVAVYWQQHPSDMPLLGSTWTQVDGMESAITVFCFALALCLYVDGKRHVLFGLSLAALTLSRLDHGVFSAFLLLGYVAHLRRDLRSAAHATLAFSTPLLIYLGLNHFLVGSAMPVSGAIKSSYPFRSRANLDKLFGLFKDPLQQSTWRFYRLAQLAIPPLVGFFADALLLRKKFSRFDEALLLCLPAIWMVAAYDLLYVDLTLHGHWYFPISTFWVSLLALRLLDGRPRGRIAGWCAAGLSLALCVYGFFVLNARKDYQTNYANFYFDYAPRIRDFYDSRRLQPRFLEIDDGIFAFSTHYPCLSGMGLALDPPAVDAFRRHQLYSVAAARGYTRLASVMYVVAPGLSTRTPSDQLWPWFRGVLSPKDAERFAFHVEYQFGAFIIVDSTPK